MTSAGSPVFALAVLNDSGGADRWGTDRTATSRAGSYRPTVAVSDEPSGCWISTVLAPATTCAFVITWCGAYTKPLPSMPRLHCGARLKILTIESWALWTRIATSGARFFGGGGTATMLVEGRS